MCFFCDKKKEEKTKNELMKMLTGKIDKIFHWYKEHYRNDIRKLKKYELIIIYFYNMTQIIRKHNYTHTYTYTHTNTMIKESN